MVKVNGVKIILQDISGINKFAERIFATSKQKERQKMPKSVLPKKLVKINMCLGKTEIIKRFIYREGSPSIKTVLQKKLVKTNVNDIQIIQGISG